MLQKQYVIFLIGALLLLGGIADLVVNGEMGKSMVVIATVLMCLAGKNVFQIEEARKANR